MRLLVDENLSYRIAEQLSRAGHDAVHVSEVGLNDTDEEPCGIGARRSPTTGGGWRRPGTVLSALRCRSTSDSSLRYSVPTRTSSTRCSFRPTGRDAVDVANLCGIPNPSTGKQQVPNVWLDMAYVSGPRGIRGFSATGGSAIGAHSTPFSGNRDRGT